MDTFMFIAFTSLLLLLLFSNAVDALNCNVSLYSDATKEIHAMLARDRYINFTGWRPGSYIHEIENGWTEDISYGDLKEMIVHLNSISEEGIIEARVFLTSGDNQILFVNTIYHSDIDGSPQKYRERFLKFNLFEDGVKIEHIYVKQDGTNGENSGGECHAYRQNIYPKIDGLLIEMNCKTTNIKNILVKVNPKS